MTENVLTRLEDTARMCMSEKRYAHTLGVYRECEYLADKCALSQKERDDLLTASLLHDIAKQLPVDKQKNICMRHGTDISGATEATLHQLSGAEYARELLGSDIVNDVVYSAVSKHTTTFEMASPFSAKSDDHCETVSSAAPPQSIIIIII